MDDNLIEYIPILIFMIFAILICVAFIFSAVLIGNQNPDPDKNAPFECGFYDDQHDCERNKCYYDTDASQCLDEKPPVVCEDLTSMKDCKKKY